MKGQLRKCPRRVRTILNFEIALWTPKNLHGNIPDTPFLHENILASLVSTRETSFDKCFHMQLTESPHTHTRTHARTHAHTHAHTHTRTHTHTHTRTHAHTHAHTHKADITESRSLVHYRLCTVHCELQKCSIMATMPSGDTLCT